MSVSRRNAFVTVALWCWATSMSALYFAQFAGKLRALAPRLFGH